MTRYYAGLDVSLEYTHICIVDQEGKVFREGKTMSEPQAITQFLVSCAVSFNRVGLEAGNLTAWLYHEMTAVGVPVICIETRHASAMLKTQNIKTDRNDARGLAHIMRTGWYKAVHVKSHSSQKLRVLLNNRRCLLDKRIDIDNQIRGTLKVFGMKVGTISASNFDARVRELLGKDTELEAYIAPLLKARKELQEQCLNLENILIKIAKDDDVCHRLMTIPGVGFLTALVFKTAIDNPIRFRSSKTVAASLGLTPRKYASGEIDYDGSITKCGDDMARSHLYEAARSLMCRTKKWNSIKAWGMRIARRSSVKNACVAVARKLATVMHRMWVDGTDFHWGKEQPEAI